MSELKSNENSLFEANLSVIQTIEKSIEVSENNKSILSDKEFLLLKLNELHKWQDSQQQLDTHLNRYELLKLEKQKLYELLGLSVTPTHHTSESGDYAAVENSTRITNDNDQHADDMDGIRPLSDVDENEEVNNDDETIYKSPNDLPSNDNMSNPIIHSFDFGSENVSEYLVAEEEQYVNIPKRPFLRRGEGLRARFRISPDAFHLNNLPKYKFAPKKTHAPDKQKSRHNQKRHQQQQNHSKSNQNNGPGEGQPNGNKKNVKNCEKAADRKHSSNGILYAKPVANLSLKQKRSSSESKFTSNDESDAILNKQIDGNTRNKIGETTNLRKIKSTGPTTPSTQALFDTPIRNKVQLQKDEINDLSLFEQLENRIASTNQLTNSQLSLSQAEMAENRSQELTLKFKVGLNLQSPPTSDERRVIGVSSSSSDVTSQQRPIIHEEPDAENAHNLDEPKHVRFASHAINFVSDDDNETVISAVESEVPSVNDIDDAIHTSSPMERSTESFQKFKEKLFDRRLNQKFKPTLSVAKQFELMDLNETDEELSIASSSAINDNNPSCLKTDHFLPATMKDLQAQRDQLQERLRDLETEIESFRRQNAELTKLIQEHDLIRLQFEEERQTAEEQLNDERIKFEVYMHDERMKLLNERNDFDRRMKEMQRPNRSERDEIIKLREQCINHEKELNARDQKHIAAQGRLRAQLRNAEKEVKELQLEVENLNRENKKLDTENIRLRRQSNNKMLQEINRNIAKLAPLQISIDDDTYDTTNIPKPLMKDMKSKKNGVKECSNKSAHKTVVAKITSHSVPTTSNHQHRLRSKSVPNLQQIDNEQNSSFSSLSSSDVENNVDVDDTHYDVGAMNKENMPTVKKSNYFPKTCGMSSKKHPSISTNEHRNAMFDKNSNPITEQSHASSNEGQKNNMKRVIENPDGSKDVWYPNGNLKKISADGMHIRMLYYNKDIKETNTLEGNVKYYYAESNTWHTTYIDGLEILEFPNGQTEHRHKDGTIEVHFPNGTVRITSPYKEKNEGIAEEWKYPDGTNVIQKVNGDRLLLLPNGQREVHTNGHKRREYPDGTVKIVYPDGSQETRYSNGRVRLKDKDGKLIMDSDTIFV